MRVTRQSLIEPVYFKFRSRYFRIQGVHGIRKVVISILDGRLTEAYVVCSKIDREYMVKDNIFGQPGRYPLPSGFIHRYAEFAFDKLICKNSGYCLRYYDTLKSSMGPTLRVTDFKLIAYCVNNKFIGGYWATIENLEPTENFEELIRPKYVKIRRNLQNLQLSCTTGEFENKLIDAIQKAFQVKTDSIKAFYGEG